VRLSVGAHDEVRKTLTPTPEHRCGSQQRRHKFGIRVLHGYCARVERALTTILTLLGFLGPAIMVLVALGTRGEASTSRFWLRVGVAFVVWYGALIGLLYLEPLS
jgi:hypothetical protein